MYFTCNKDMKFKGPGAECYGLSNCVPSKFVSLSPNSPMTVFGDRDFMEVNQAK